MFPNRTGKDFICRKWMKFGRHFASDTRNKKKSLGPMPCLIYTRCGDNLKLSYQEIIMGEKSCKNNLSEMLLLTQELNKSMGLICSSVAVAITKKKLYWAQRNTVFITLFLRWSDTHLVCHKKLAHRFSLKSQCETHHFCYCSAVAPLQH